MESNWRWNVAEMEQAASDWRLAARVLDFFPLNVVVMLHGSDVVWVAAETFDPDQPRFQIIGSLDGVTLTSLWEDGLIESD